MKQFRIHKSIMKYLTDKDLSLNAKGFLTIVLFNEELPGIDVAKYCSDNKETILKPMCLWQALTHMMNGMMS